MLSLAPGRPPDAESSAPDDGPDPLAALAAAARSEDSAAIRVFVERIGPVLLKVVRKILGDHHPDVDDVTQDAAFAVMTALASFRGECRTVHFVSRVAALTAMAARRRARYRDEWTPATDPVSADRLGITQPGQHAYLVAERRRVAIRRLLDELPPPQSEVLCLHHVLGLGIAEIAGSSGVEVNTVRSRLRRAKQTLLARIQGDRGLLELLGDGGMGEA